MSSSNEIRDYFSQDPPRIGNQWDEDFVLKSIVMRHLKNEKASEEMLQSIEKDLKLFGERAVKELNPIARSMDLPENHPRLKQYDAWGKKVDEIITCDGWKHMNNVSAEEGLVSISYQKSYGKHSRFVQFVKLSIFDRYSGLFSCPLAMTDGASKVLQPLYQAIKLGAKNAPEYTKQIAQNFGPEFPRKDIPDEAVVLIQEAYERLTSRDPKRFWTSGQWMTERRGGSDVSNATETIARPQADGTYKLYGYKWFTSATDANVSITLARIEDPTTKALDENLTCFLLRVRKDDGTLNNMNCIKLKNKLGTKQLPTAELELVGSRAYMISLRGRGVPAIASGMVNITRLHNASGSVGALRGAAALVRDYSHRRAAFGSLLCDNNLHVQTLANIEVNYRACANFTFDAINLLGKLETGEKYPEAQEDELLLRLLTPLAKLYTAKVAVATASECLECFGGQGYIEDTGLPKILRDAQVLPIWEGTTNVLSLDVLRVLAKTNGGSLDVFSKRIHKRCSPQSLPSTLVDAGKAVITAFSKIQSFLEAAAMNREMLEVRARALSLSLAKVYAASCLIEHAAYTMDPVDIEVANRWCTADEPPLVEPSIATGANSAPGYLELTKRIALDIPFDKPAESAFGRGYGNINQETKAPRFKL